MTVMSQPSSNAPFVISPHAVAQYRARVIACPERSRCDETLRRAMVAEILFLPWQLRGGETFAVKAGPLRPRRRYHKHLGFWAVAHVTHTFLIERSCVVTVLGFLMKTSRRKNRFKRHARFMRGAS